MPSIRLHAYLFAALLLASMSPATAQLTRPDGDNLLPAAQLVFSFNPVRFAHSVTSDTFWLIGGGSVEFSGAVSKHLSAVANVYGGRASYPTAGENNLNLITYTFGPRYTFTSKSGRYNIFGEGLVGEARGTNADYPASVGSRSARSFALLAGSGVDLRVTKHFAFRPIEIEYLRTQLPVAHGSPQDNVRVGMGVVLRLGVTQKH